MATLQSMNIAARRSFLRVNYFICGLRQSVLARKCSSANEAAVSFDDLFRNSQFVKLGRPAGKTVVGCVTHIVNRESNKDIYVDFGWKFHAVESVPIHKEINVGDKVDVNIKSLEATGHFLGQSKRITLNEAEATIFKRDNEIQKFGIKKNTY